MLEIKSMKLYNHVERIYRELGELGKSLDDPLSVEELSPFDQLHYHGTDALDVALALLGGEAGENWLEIGSGLGGPARYLAANSEVRITALELQRDQHEVAVGLTERCGLSDRVEHVCADILNINWPEGHFDAIVSWLSLYHIPERPKLLEKCHRMLKPGGYFYTEDLTARGDIDDSNRRRLERDLYAKTLRHINDYKQDLENFGFDVGLAISMSSDWAEHVRVRLAEYRAQRARHLRVHGEAPVNAMTDFYTEVNRHFQAGRLGGLRLCASRRD